MRRELGVLAATAALLVGLAVATPVAAAGSSRVAGGTGLTPAGFSSPLLLLTGQFQYVSEVVDSTNHVHIAATGRHGLWYITDRGGSWSHTMILHDLTNKSYVEPSIALDTNDRVHISVARNACDDCAPGSTTGIYYLTDKGRARGTFPSTPTKIAPHASGEGTLKVANGHLFLSYVNPCCMPGPLPKVLLRTNASGSWTTTQVAPHGDDPSLRVGTDGKPRVTYSRSDGIHYGAASSPTGSFSVIHVPGTGINDSGARLALDTNNRPHLAWYHDTVSTSDIEYGWRDLSGWSGPTFVLSNPNFGFMTFDLDSLGRPNVALGDQTIRNELRSGGTWHETPVASGVDVRYMAERRAFNGHVAIAWADFSGGIWLSRN